MTFSTSSPAWSRGEWAEARARSAVEMTPRSRPPSVTSTRRTWACCISRLTSFRSESGPTVTMFLVITSETFTSEGRESLAPRYRAMSRSVTTPATRLSPLPSTIGTMPQSSDFMIRNTDRRSSEGLHEVGSDVIRSLACMEAPFDFAEPIDLCRNRSGHSPLFTGGHMGSDPRRGSDRKSTRLLQSRLHLVCRLLLEKKKHCKYSNT